MEKIRQKLQHMSIQAKVFISMFFGSVALMLVLTVLTLSIVFVMFTQRENQSTYNQLGYISDQIDFYLNIVEDYSRTVKSAFFVQEIGHSAKTNEDIPLYIPITSVYSNINIPSIVDFVAIYDVKGNLIVSTENRVTSDKIEFTAIDDRWVSSSKYSSTLNKIIPTLSYYSKYYSINTGEFLGFIELSIDEKTISNIYSAYTSSDYRIIIADSDGVIQSSSDNSELRTEYRSFDKLNKSDSFAGSYGKNKVVFKRYLDKLDWHIVCEISLATFFNSAIIVFFIFLAVITIALIIYFRVAKNISAEIISPINAFITHTSKVREGRWTPIDETIANDNDILEMFRAFNHMLTAQNQLRDQLIETQKKKFRLEHDILQRQINSHFLYNTLDTILALAEISEIETLTNMIMNLSAFYRYSLSNGKNIITIKEELELTEHYLNILQIRNRNRFEFNISCPEALKDYYTLKLILQVVIENSLEHGFWETLDNNVISISVLDNQDYIIFTITDNGVGLNEQPDSSAEHYGLSNVRQRIQLYYGLDCGVRIKNNPTGGCITTLTIKKEAIPREEI